MGVDGARGERGGRVSGANIHQSPSGVTLGGSTTSPQSLLRPPSKPLNIFIARSSSRQLGVFSMRKKGVYPYKRRLQIR